MKRNQLVTISKGNRKLGGVMNISTSPRTCCPRGRPLREQRMLRIQGLSALSRHPQGMEQERALAKRHPDSYFMQIAAQVAEHKPRLFRWHVAGDILSTDYLRGMCRIAAANPHTHFLAFTKAFDIVNRYEDREAVPGNLVIVFSAWPGMRFVNPHRHRVAWMQDGTETRVPEDAIGVRGTVRPVACAMSYRGWAAM